MAKTVVRAMPRISINKLGEYLVAPAGRRRRIIYDQKRPPVVQVSLYTEAHRAIVNCLYNSDDGALLDQALESLYHVSPANDFEALKKSLCIDALEAFADMLDDLDFDGTAMTIGESDPPKLQIGGVEVSVRPDLILSGKDRNGSSRVGLIKLYINKGFPLDETSGQYVAVGLQAFADQHLTDLGGSDHRMIYVLDILGGRVFKAPKSNTRRLNDIEAACQEIAANWPRL